MSRIEPVFFYCYSVEVSTKGFSLEGEAVMDALKAAMTDVDDRRRRRSIRYVFGMIFGELSKAKSHDILTYLFPIKVKS